ncbi:rhomboid family intramembrane serine protease [Flavobacterium beibuense]|uniref:rhomboid family intramembrane serine protease n=1 Tax=Flavobacterium beibuense TaxID=657326 RepID=UPI003A91C990
MQEYILKLKLIILPYLGILFGTATIYLIFFYVFILKLQIDIKDNLTSIVIPAAIATLGSLIWLRPRLKLLTFKKDSGDIVFHMTAITASLFFSASLGSIFKVITNPIVHLSNITEIDNTPKSFYYTIDNFDVLKEFEGSTYTVKNVGKNNERIELELYYVAPISHPDTNPYYLDSYKYWLCQSFKMIRDAKMDKNELNREFTIFQKKCSKDFENKKYLEKLNHLEKLSHSDQKIYSLKAIEKIITNTPKDIVLLSPKKELPSNGLKGNIQTLTISFFVGLLLNMLLLLLVKVNHEEIYRRKHFEKEPALKLLLVNIKKQKNIYITFILIGINIIAFICMLFLDVDFMHPTTNELSGVGALDSYLVTNGEVWRIFTHIFIHGGFAHLSYNMISLFLIGSFTESSMGHYKYLTIYIVGGLIGGLCSLFFNDTTISVGASGAIFALYGAGFIYSSITKEKILQITITVLGGFSLLLGFTMPGIDNAAHMGGLITGGILSVIFFYKRR